jgi:hypothetical protein
MFDRSEGFPHLRGVMAGHLQRSFEFHSKCHVYLSDKKAEVEIPEG